MPKRRKSKSLSCLTKAQVAQREARKKYEVSEIVDFRMSSNNPNQLEVKVGWGGCHDFADSWIPFEGLYSNIILRDFVKKKMEDHSIEIYVIVECLKQEIKQKISDTLDTKTLSEIMLEDACQFDYFEYMTMQVVCHQAQFDENEVVCENINTRLQDLIFKNYFFQLEKVQLATHKKILEKIKHVEDIDLTIENLVDFDVLEEIVYISKNIVDESLRLPENNNDVKKEQGCSCVKKCSPLSDCCPKILNKPTSYRFNDKKLHLKYVHSQSIVECGPSCKCDLNCPNRLTQRPTTVKLCLFKTFNERGWGVKTREAIKGGTFILEYCGELINTVDAENRDSKYLYDISTVKTKDYTLDALHYGNLGRYINHSCKANAMMFGVNDCMQIPENERLCLFATKDIEDDEEITVNYRPDTGEEIFIQDCKCLSSNCKKIIK